MDLEDDLFLALARKAGLEEATIDRCRRVQRGRAAKGEPASLFAWAKARGLVSKDDVRRIERWAERASGSDTAFDEAPVACERCAEYVEVLAVMEGRAIEVEAGVYLCGRCARESGAEDELEAEVARDERASRAGKRRGLARRFHDSARLVARGGRRLARSARVVARTIAGRPSSLVAAGVMAGALGLMAIPVLAMSPRGVPETKAEPRSEPVVAIERTPAHAGDAAPVVVARAPSAAERAAVEVEACARAEAEGRSSEALARLDAALAEAAEGPGRRTLALARDELLEKLRGRIERDGAEARRRAEQGEEVLALGVVAKLKARMPRALAAEVASVAREVEAALGRARARALAERAGAEARARHDAEVARYGKLRTAVDAALAELDVASARRALSEAERFADADLERKVSSDRRRISGVEAIFVYAAHGLGQDAGAVVSLARRKGPKVEGRLVSAASGVVRVRLDRDGEIELGIAELAVTEVLARAKRVKRPPDECHYGRGVVLACLGDRKAAIDALDQAATIPEAAELATELRACAAVAGGPQR